MKQKLILLALVMSLTIVSQSSMSLGMGKIQVYSALNEPLQSSINLLTNGDEELLELEVELASREDYQKVGLDKSFVPANIMVSFDEENPYQINVTSNGPVTEPIVSLLLDVNWSNGRILREFTILLDPPAYEAVNTAPQVNNVVVEPIQDAVIEENVEQQTATEQAELDESNSNMTTDESTTVYTNEDVVDYTDIEETETTATVDESYGYNNASSEVTVESGDTLWSIANNNKLSSLSTQQMMMAIYNKNPDAFLDNNINKLSKGSRLVMPSSDEADDIGFTEAMNQVESHRQSWTPAQQDYNTFQTEDTEESDAQVSSQDLDYGVQLSGSDDEGSDDGQSNSDTGSDAKALALEEDLYNKDAENNDLKERISELEGIVEQQQDVLEIDDDGLANLENQLADAADASEDELDQAVEEVVDEAEAIDTNSDDIWDEASQTDSSQVEQTVGSEELSLDVDASDDTAAMADTDGMSDDESGLLDDSAGVDALDTGAEDDLQTGDFDDNSDSLADQNMEDDTDVVEEELAEQQAAQSTPVIKSRAKQNKEESMVDNVINWVMDNLMWVIIGVVVLIVLLFIPKMLSGRGDDDEDETSFLDDIKNRNKAEKEQQEVVIDDVETKLNQPLVDDEDDVLADLDSRIDFDDKEVDKVTVKETTVDLDSGDDEITELSGEGEFEVVEDDGFDLDGFLNDDDSDDITATKDHSATMADVSFDDDDSADDDLNFDDLDLSLDDDVSEETEELSDEVDEAVNDFKKDVEDASEVDGDDVAAEILQEKAEEIKDSSDEFSFDDDEEFDFDLDEELEELEQSNDLETVDEVDVEKTENDDFNDMLDISDEDSETFEITDEEESVEENDLDEEIDLGLEDLMDDADAIDTKLDLAKAYIDMGDAEGAKNLLDEVISEGNDEQVTEAKKLLDDM